MKKINVAKEMYNRLTAYIYVKKTKKHDKRIQSCHKHLHVCKPSLTVHWQITNLTVCNDGNVLSLLALQAPVLFQGYGNIIWCK